MYNVLSSLKWLDIYSNAMENPRNFSFLILGEDNIRIGFVWWRRKRERLYIFNYNYKTYGTVINIFRDWGDKICIYCRNLCDLFVVCKKYCPNISLDGGACILVCTSLGFTSNISYNGRCFLPHLPIYFLTNMQYLLVKVQIHNFQII